ncbi:MAG: glycosyl hydrolase family 18 protein [Bacteroidota bacterium]
MLTLKIAYRLIRHYWYVPLILVFGLFLFQSGLISYLSGTQLRVLNTPTKISKVMSIGQLITAQYYGESLASLHDVYQGMDESELFANYVRLQKTLAKKSHSKKELRKDKYYALFKHVSSIRKNHQFERMLEQSSWKDFEFLHQQRLAEEVQKYLRQHAGSEELVYMGRGIVQAGFDLTKLDPQHIEEIGDTIWLHKFEPIVFPAKINPWMAAEKKIPGFQVVSEHKQGQIPMEQIALVKEACQHRLKHQAISHGLLKKAIRNAETELSAFFSQIEQAPKIVRIGHPPHLNLQHKILVDSVVNKHEVQQIAKHIATHPNDSASYKALVHKVHTTAKEVHGSFDEVQHAISKDAPVKSVKEIEQGTSGGGSAHQHQASYFAAQGHKHETSWDSVWKIKTPPPPAVIPKKRKPHHKTFGWHPEWMGSAYKHYRFDLLWGVSYFGCKLDPQSGDIQDLEKWQKTGLVEKARAEGTNVFMTISNFGFSKNRAFLSDSAAQNHFIDQIPGILASRQAHGLNIDFEQVPGKMKKAFNDFLLRLSDNLKIHGYTLSLCLYAVDFNQVFDIPRLKDAIEVFTMMGYDYYYAGSHTAGPVAPLGKGKKVASNYYLERSIDSYLARGVPPEKFIVALPYYGSEWKTASHTIPSPNDGHVRSPAYRQIVKIIGRKKDKWMKDVDTKVHRHKKGKQHYQLWYDDAESLKNKYQWIKQKGLAGPGIWALGYDNGHNELWDLLQTEFGEE